MKRVTLTETTKTLMGIKDNQNDDAKESTKNKWNTNIHGKDYTTLNNAIWDFFQDSEVKALRKTDKQFDSVLDKMWKAMDVFHNGIGDVDKYFYN